MKDGDRYFFTHKEDADLATHPFTLEQMNNLMNRNLGDILCDNTNIRTVRDNVFLIGGMEVTCPTDSTLDLNLFF